MKRIFWLIMLLPLTAFAQEEPIKVVDGQFLRDGSPYYYIGTNFWYGPILASDGEGGNMERLKGELDCLKGLGVENLRIIAGADEGSTHANTVYPYLQQKPGVFNDTLLVGLDRFLVELAKRGMTCVIYLNNSWDWSGGYGFYLKYAGKGDSPASGEGQFHNYARYASEFVRTPKAKELFYNYVKTIVSRTNSITGKPYKDDPTIMAWQIGNEPRSFSLEGKKDFMDYLHHTAKLIKEYDSNHMVSVGSEGSVGCENDLALYDQIHADENIDYLTIHIWPQNWKWCTRGRLWEDLPYVYQQTDKYLRDHLHIASKLGKPLVIEEFGYPRDGVAYTDYSYTTCRDGFYEYIMGLVVKSASTEGKLAGCNFWGWGGQGRPVREEWQRGDDYICDPPHEPQGWYSVYNTDSTTLSIIINDIEKIAKIAEE